VYFAFPDPFQLRLKSWRNGNYSIGLLYDRKLQLVMPVPSRLDHGKGVQTLPSRPGIAKSRQPRKSGFPLNMSPYQTKAMRRSGGENCLDVVFFYHAEDKFYRWLDPKYPRIRHQQVGPHPYRQFVRYAFPSVFENHPRIFYGSCFNTPKDAVRLPNGEFQHLGILGHFLEQ